MSPELHIFCITTPDYIAAENPLNCKMRKEPALNVWGNFSHFVSLKSFPEGSEYWESGNIAPISSLRTAPHDGRAPEMLSHLEGPQVQNEVMKPASRSKNKGKEEKRTRTNHRCVFITLKWRIPSSSRLSGHSCCHLKKKKLITLESVYPVCLLSDYLFQVNSLSIH